MTTSTHTAKDVAGILDAAVDAAAGGHATPATAKGKPDKEQIARQKIAALCHKVATDAAFGNGSHAGELVATLRRLVNDTETELSKQNNLPVIHDVPAWIQDVYPPPDQLLDGVFDKGTKLAIIGASKTGKTWFALHLALALASGTRFLQWHAAPRRVLLVNLEIPEAHMQRRIKKVLTGICAETFQGAMHVMNARGRAGEILVMEQAGRSITADWAPAFLSKVIDEKYDLIIFDPLYKLQSLGDENKAEDLKPVLHAFDKLAEATGAAVAYVHHMAKGFGGDRQTIDRAAGSGAIARDFDACIVLTRHAVDGLIVMETIVRNYMPPEDTSIRWNSDLGRFDLDTTPPQVRTSRTAAGTSGMSDADMRQTALDLVKNGAIPNAEWEQGMRDAGISRDAASRIKTTMIKTGHLFKSKKRGYGGPVYIGTASNITILPDKP